MLQTGPEASSPSFLGQERVAEGGRKHGVGENRKVVRFYALPSTFPPSSPLSSRDLVRTPWPERSPSRPLLVRRLAPRSGHAPRSGVPGVGPSPLHGSLIIAPSVRLPFPPRFNRQTFASSHWEPYPLTRQGVTPRLWTPPEPRGPA